jgi:hypothetical protein
MDGGAFTFIENLGVISHNVPAVYDVFAARIRACEASFRRNAARAAKMWVD